MHQGRNYIVLNFYASTYVPFNCTWHSNETLEFFLIRHEILVYNPTMNTSLMGTI